MVRELPTTLLAIGVGMICLAGWASAVKHDYRRSEPLLAMAWVACPPCGVARGGYLLFNPR